MKQKAVWYKVSLKWSRCRDFTIIQRKTVCESMNVLHDFSIVIQLHRLSNKSDIISKIHKKELLLYRSEVCIKIFVKIFISFFKNFLTFFVKNISNICEVLEFKHYCNKAIFKNFESLWNVNGFMELLR